ncbi:hypothetical protein [Flagellimonas nanhaiensis]|nr:hypothetical protein [Allomuricauda nanhaiensis]
MSKASITISTIHVRFFKGLKDVKVDFIDQDATIRGCNGSGKTTLFDAFTWSLFGSDSQGNSDSKFNIKTLDKDNNVIPRVDHSVELTLGVDGKEVVIKRILKEKWVKVRGSLEPTFQGNKSEFFWNDVPKTSREFQDKVNGIIDESIFKLLSNPLGFNQLHWEKQRNILITIAGEVSDSELATGNDSFTKLLSKLSDKSLGEYKKELAAKRKKLKDAIADIPARIDEVGQGKPEQRDFDSLKQELGKQEVSLNMVQSQIDDLNKAAESVETEKKKIRDKIFELTTSTGRTKLELKQLLEQNQLDPYKREKEIQSDLSIKESEHTNLLTQKNDLSYSLDRSESKIRELDAELVKLREEFNAESKKKLVFGDDFKCPTCHRPLEEEDVEKQKKDMQSDFNEDKAKSLEILNKKGLQLKERLEDEKEISKNLQDKINEKVLNLKDCDKEIKSLKVLLEEEKSKPKADQQSIESQLQDKLDFNKDYQACLKEIKELEVKLENFKAPDNQELIKKKNELSEKIDGLKTQLREEQSIIDADKRIKELSESESSYAQQIADVEKEEFVAQEFTVAKVSALESRVNKLFGDGIKWKLFTKQINGAEVPTCQLTYNGVPWPDLNTASQINTGIEVINVLSAHYGINFPIWVDGRESVTNLQETESQVINLVVSEEHKTLTVV